VRYYLFIISLLSFHITGFSQSSATARFTASVQIIEPIEIKTLSNMNFASINAGKGGTVTLSPENLRSATGEIQLEESAGQTPAIFEIKGQSQYSYQVALPQQAYLIAPNAEPILIKDFVALNDHQTFNSNAQLIRLGASLEISEGQSPGQYRSAAPIEITVSYN